MLWKIVAAVDSIVAKRSTSLESAVKCIVNPAGERPDNIAGAAYAAVRPG